MTASRPFHETQAELLKDPETAAIYLEEAGAAGDADAFKLARRNLAQAELAASAGEKRKGHGARGKP